MGDPKPILRIGGALAGAFVMIAIMLNRGEPQPTKAEASVAFERPRGGRAASFSRAFALQRQGRLDEAISEYRAFLARHPDHSNARFNLGHALMASRACSLAIPEFERALELNPFKTTAHLHIAKCARIEGQDSLATVHQAHWDSVHRGRSKRNQNADLASAQ